MIKKEVLSKIKKIGELFKEIRSDNRLVTQDLEQYIEKVAKLRILLKDESVIKFTNAIDEILVIVDENVGFTTKGAFKNPYMEALIEPTNKMAQEFANAPNKFIIAINEKHHEGSQEFKTFPEHCKENTEEAEYAEALKWILSEYVVFEKNTTMAAFAPGFLDFLTIFPNLKNILFAGGVTDICYMEAVLSTKKFLDQNDLDIEVTALKDLADTYDAPMHNREEWNRMSFRFMEQGGIKIKQKI
ncbi:MAG: isochorismatase family protein [Bacilli bacterium]|nr:isochorismatase family protein [Bacilli bacterium]